jgi:hypothetical protein
VLRETRKLHATTFVLAGLLAAAVAACGGSSSSAKSSPTVDVRNRATRAALTPTTPERRHKKFGPPKGKPDRIPAHIVPEGSLFQISHSIIEVTNGWIVSDGRHFTFVAAGAATDPATTNPDPTLGRFYFLRQNWKKGSQGQQVVDVPGHGALKITRAPKGKKVETSAQRADIEFLCADGTPGVLHLRDDTYTLRSSPPTA